MIDGKEVQLAFTGEYYQRIIQEEERQLDTFLPPYGSVKQTPVLYLGRKKVRRNRRYGIRGYNDLYKDRRLRKKGSLITRAKKG
jgi:lactam utilization protein B